MPMIEPWKVWQSANTLPSCLIFKPMLLKDLTDVVSSRLFICELMSRINDSQDDSAFPKCLKANWQKSFSANLIKSSYWSKKCSSSLFNFSQVAWLETTAVKRFSTSLMFLHGKRIVDLRSSSAQIFHRYNLNKYVCGRFFVNLHSFCLSMYIICSILETLLTSSISLTKTQSYWSCQTWILQAPCK